MVPWTLARLACWIGRLPRVRLVPRQVGGLMLGLVAALSVAFAAGCLCAWALPAQRRGWPVEGPPSHRRWGPARLRKSILRYRARSTAPRPTCVAGRATVASLADRGTPSSADVRATRAGGERRERTPTRRSRT